MRRLFEELVAPGVAFPAWFSPLVLYGPTGSGKSALARSLVPRLASGSSGRRVFLATGADFLRLVAGAIDQQTTPLLVARLRGSSLVWIDDLHGLERSEAAQDFLLPAIDQLAEAGVPLLVTLPDWPAAIRGLRAGLASRLCGGLTVPVGLPGPVARKEILTRLADRQEISLDPTVIDLLADRFPVSVPLLYRILSTLTAASLSGSSGVPADESAVRRIVDSAGSHPAFPGLLVESVAGCIGVTTADILGTSRQLNTVLARSLVVYLLRNSALWSFTRIGKLLDGKDHSTLLHACRKIALRREEDLLFSGMVRRLESKVGELLANCLPDRPPAAVEPVPRHRRAKPGKTVRRLLAGVGGEGAD